MVDKKKIEKKVLTQEEKDAQAIEAQAKIEAARQRQKELNRYEERVSAMSFKQLRGELKRNIRKPADTSLLTSAFAVVLETVLSNTQTPENPFAKLAAYPR